MSLPPLAADPRALASLKAQAANGAATPATQREVARQFEAVFAQMMIHSMRSTHFADDGLGQAGTLYTSMFDQQIAQSMTQGKGLGLAQMLMRQFQHNAAPGTGPATDAKAAGSAARAAMTNVAGNTPALRSLNATNFTGTALVTIPAAASAVATTNTTVVASEGVPAKILNFVSSLLPQAQAIAQRLGVSARMIIAQAALETGWGQHGVGSGSTVASSHNLFGIKASGDSASTTATTTEYIDGRPQQVTASFRRYDSDAAALQGYADLISGSPRYQAVAGSGDDAERFAGALQRAGYATDPNYAQKLVAVADSPHLAAAINAANAALNS